MRQKCCLFFLLLVLPAVAFCATSRAVATYLNLPDGTQCTKFVADGTGNFFVTSLVPDPSGTVRTRVDKVDAKGELLASMAVDGTAAAIALDPGGNLVIAGSTSSQNFPLVSPLFTKFSQEAAFVMKVDAQLRTILFSTVLGGTQGTSGSGASTFANSVVADGTGNIYVTGGTFATDFPVTPGAYQTRPPPGNNFGSALYAFVSAISGDGQKLLSSTYFGTDPVACIGGSHCLGAHGQTNATAIALDIDRNVVIAGNTTADQLPVAPGVLGPNCGGCTSDAGTGFIAKFDSTGSKLLWASYLPIRPQILSTDVRAIALDTSENVSSAESPLVCK